MLGQIVRNCQNKIIRMFEYVVDYQVLAKKYPYLIRISL